ncbi:hypothetical protein AYM40_30295 [Paraburkholderia phytofirmans OLGA172]|uniref:DUF3331 domain-containing protein n=1 Tax=Paraburkholderia phytofirmans OLGA172 TaxID=1417228 RepID=A0A160FTJ4_9BURK|nr:DUF3331 domain-containing protein [Paraburkholderia phytofirmans]ANB76500.1 hypothetical protein AYM40_30295 [Paraburkholderia phytofirmans OLGA172]
MLLLNPACDPWQRTVGALSSWPDGEPTLPGATGHFPIKHAATESKGKSPCVSGGLGLVKVIERLNETTAVIDWRDSTAGCYTEQVWRVCVARVTGQCALSGAAIKKGDAVYRPRTNRNLRANAAFMILSSELDNAFSLVDC